ncbi:MAG TPA: phosphomannomutase/phosphoglucomutase [Candidatus Saccharimonadales bacterium]|nr:phosphomannomutase/phosphoglucomutase [Candidatus Saccharimonadales bacterium]
MDVAVLNAIFKAYDIRGKVGSELTIELAEYVGRAIAAWLPAEGAVAIGRDMRPDSEALAQAITKGLCAGGRNVVDIGMVTSDMIYHAVGQEKLAGGAMVTASHNPGKDNGIKLCREEAKPISIDSGLADIRELIAASRFADADRSGTVRTLDVTESWIQHVLSFVDPAKLTPLRLAVDAGNGMAGAIFPALEKHVPWRITEMYFDLDGTFPNHEANPLKFETLVDLIATIREQKLDGGIAFDGDGDRAFLVDETGTVLTGGVMSAMLSEYFLEKYPGANIVYDVRNSKTVPDIIAEKGGTPVRSRVGHSLIKEKMREVDAPFGGEASGHFYFKDNWYTDSGIIGAVIGLYVATLKNKKLSELREHYTRYAAIPETNFEIADKQGAITRLAEHFKEAKQDTLDGLTAMLSNGAWVNIRPSNTESLLRLNAEAKDQATLDVLVKNITTIIKQK